MTRDEHLLTIAVEECAEVAQLLSKALRSGVDEVQPGQALTNRQRIRAEFYGLRLTLGMCGIVPHEPIPAELTARRIKI